jgi:hypothetical protein
LQRGLDVGLQLGLIVLGDQDVVPAGQAYSAGQVALGEDGIARDNLATQGEHVQQLQGGLVFVGRGRDTDLGQDSGGGRDEGTQQVDAGGLAVRRALEDLAVQRDGLPTVLQAALQPQAEGILEGVDVQAAEEAGEGGLGGGLLAAEPQGVGQGEAVVTAELGDGLQAFATAEDGEGGQGEDGGQGMASATGFAGIRDQGEGLDQG